MKTLQKHHKAKKSLGQNFLKSELALREIIKAGEIKKEDIILEIGPGKGALTEKLLENSGHVIAIEKDRDLIEFLKEKFAEQIKLDTLVLVNDDILEINPSETISNFSSGDDAKQDTTRKISKSFHYKIIANIPYNITGAILKKFLTEENQPELMVLMVQNEVAKRIVARDEKESLLSISVKAYGEPKIIMKVPKRYFSPAPKVDSAVIKINNISHKIFIENKINEKKFWEILHAGFAHKRKVLISNLKEFYGRQPARNASHSDAGGDLPLLTEVFKNFNLSDKIRAEDLTLNNWISLTKVL